MNQTRQQAHPRPRIKCSVGRELKIAKQLKLKRKLAHA